MKHLKRCWKTAVCLGLALLCMCVGTALAATRWADMGIGSVSADTQGVDSFTTNKGETITVFDAEDELGFEVERTDTSYSVMLQTPVQSGWYTITVKNQGVLSQNSAAPGGLHLWLINSDHEPVLADVEVVQGTTELAVRLEGNRKYRLTFLAYNNTAGIVTFRLGMDPDPGAEWGEEAAEAPAGTLCQESIAVNRDQDWYRIPPAADEREILFSVQNAMEGTLNIDVCNTFWMPVSSNSYAAGETALMQLQAEADTEYYLCIQSAEEECGAYVFTWCDGIHHAFDGSACSLCGTPKGQ